MFFISRQIYGLYHYIFYKLTPKGWIPSEEFSLNFGHTVQILADTNNIN